MQAAVFYDFKCVFPKVEQKVGGFALLLRIKNSFQKGQLNSSFKQVFQSCIQKIFVLNHRFSKFLKHYY